MDMRPLDFMDRSGHENDIRKSTENCKVFSVDLW